MATKKKTAKSAPKKPAKPVKKQASAKKTAPKKPVAKKHVVKHVLKPSLKKSVKPMPPKKVIAKHVVAKPASPKSAKDSIKIAPLKTVPKEIKAKDIKVPPAKAVVIPKISTKTVRKYQPEFTKSVLDRPKSDPGAPSMRYSDTELTEFKEIILRKLDAAKKELSYLHGLITRKDEMGGDEADNRYMTMEDGSLSMEREQLSQMASRQITFIDHLEKALMRIENKTYGICRVTGRLIDKARLRAVPHATLSIEAKMGSSKQ
jgi:RNA polymerase-binding transcription factor DksA